MIFTKKKILGCMDSGNIRIHPYSADQLNTNSYNVTLGNWFYYVKLIDGERTYFGPKRFDVGERVLVDEFNGLRHAVFIPAECCELHRGHSDIGNAINYIRGQAPGMAIRKVELI